MMESPFQITHQILTEIPNVVDELRIIAKDAKLTAVDRDAVMRGSDELELAQRTVALLYAELIEARQQLDATRQRISSVSSQFPFMSMGTGQVIPKVSNP